MRILLCLAVTLLASPLFAQEQPMPDGWQQAGPDNPVLAQPSPGLDPNAAAVQTAMQAAQPPVPNGAIAAMLAIDPKYTDGIVVVTARGGTPEPRQWSIVARDTNDNGTLHLLTVAGGQVVGDRLSLNAYESFRQNVAIDPTQVQVDSDDAFLIAQPIAAANQKIIGHIDYALTVRGKDTTPIWTLNCFDLNGGYMGKVVLLATTGTVLQTPGFRNAPSSP